MGVFVAAHPDCVTERKDVRIDRVVIHIAEGSAAGTIAWFQMGRAQRAEKWAKRLGLPVADPKVQRLSFPTAAHFVFDYDGAVTQMVLEAKKCSHANAFNSRSIGIEHAGRTNIGGFPEAMLRASAALVRDICHRRDIPPDRAHVVGHNEVPGATHTDPGVHWDWDHYMQLVRG